MADSLGAKATLVGGMQFSAESGTGFTMALDAAAESGGQNSGARPMELLLMGLGGCTAMDVISILRKMQQDVTAYEVAVRGERAEDHPRVYTDIVVEHRLHGRGLAVDRVRRAVELSATKYCPASAMLGKSATLRHDYLVIDADTGATVDKGSLSH